VRNERNRDMADTISRLFWDNFIKSEPALTMRDVIAIELEKAEDRSRIQVLKSIAANLAQRYRDDQLETARLCDEVLDRSGALLGYVREAAAL
jgi:hypothetical protein